MTTNSDAVFCYENSMRCVCFHDTVKQWLELEGWRLNGNTHKCVLGLRYTATRGSHFHVWGVSNIPDMKSATHMVALFVSEQ